MKLNHPVAASSRRAVFAACLLAALPAQGQAQAIFTPSPVPPRPVGGGRVTGQVTGLTSSTARLALRRGSTIVVRLRAAKANHLVPQIYVGEFLTVQGIRTGHGTMVASAVARAKSAPSAWVPDIP